MAFFLSPHNIQWRSFLWSHSVSLERTPGFWRLGRRRKLRTPQFVWYLLLNPPTFSLPCLAPPPQSSSMVGDPWAQFLLWMKVEAGWAVWLWRVGRGPAVQLLLIQTSSPNFSPVPPFVQYLVLPSPELVRNLVGYIFGFLGFNFLYSTLLG